ncbi:MAG: hypothetical protein KDD70_06415 [Bdellovibrionales bacterium]|nr:hypothetical protein [Bdellovibrionales bacterium]
MDPSSGRIDENPSPITPESGSIPESASDLGWETLSHPHFDGPVAPVSSNLHHRASLTDIIHSLKSALKGDSAIKVHPLGFVQIALDPTSSHRLHSGLRINIWPKGYKLEDGNDIHAHSFAMTSRVLNGAIENFEYAWRDTPAGKNSIGHITHSEDSRHFLTDTGRRGEFRLAKHDLTREGEEYHVQKGRFHTTQVVGDQLTITLIDRYDIDESAPNPVISTTGLEKPVVYDARPLTQDQARELVTEAIKTLQQKEQHTLLDTEPVKKLLNLLFLQQRTVVELGVGSGALTELILDRGPAKVIGYELFPEATPASIAGKIDLRVEDIAEVDFSYLANGDPCIIALPPYSLLTHIREQIIDRYNVRDVILSVPESQRREFPDFEIAGSFDGSAFDPPTRGRHLLLYKGFGTTAERRRDSQPGLIHRDLRQALSDKWGLRLDGQWNTEELLQDMVQRCSDAIEHSTLGEKLGQNRRVVVFLSDNEQKIPEWQKHFNRYGIEVATADNFEHPDFVRSLLNIDIDGVRIVGVLHEASNLFRAGTDTLSTQHHLEVVDNVSTLTAYGFEGENLVGKVYTHRTPGMVDHERRDPNRPGVFGWDDIFVLDSVGRTYDELRRDGHKISSRDMTVAEFIRDRFYYKNRIDLTFAPQGQEATVDFGNSVEEFIRSNPYMSDPSLEAVGLTSMFRRVVNEGVFFRSAKNRREKNYWFAALNGGLPFTPKRDPIHEAKYTVHDLGHMDILEPVFSGKNSPELARVYCAARMMSEAFTLVEADMIFPHALAEGGVQYNFEKHQAYPLFRSLGIDLKDPDNRKANLRKIFYANARYCLTGDDSEYRKLLGDSTEGREALEKYKSKFMPFFVEDYRWTERNWENMTTRGDEFAKWWSMAQPIRDAVAPGLLSVEEFADAIRHRPGDLVDQVFEHYFEDRIVPAFTVGDEYAPRGKQLAAGFRRYMMGQMAILARYDFAAGAEQLQKDISDSLIRHYSDISLAEVEQLRAHYDRFVDRLTASNLITTDDAATYKEIYPLFDPYYVFYDEGTSFYENLESLARKKLDSFRPYRGEE